MSGKNRPLTWGPVTRARTLRAGLNLGTGQNALGTQGRGREWGMLDHRVGWLSLAEISARTFNSKHSQLKAGGLGTRTRPRGSGDQPDGLQNRALGAGGQDGSVCSSEPGTGSRGGRGGPGGRNSARQVDAGPAGDRRETWCSRCARRLARPRVLGQGALGRGRGLWEPAPGFPGRWARRAGVPGQPGVQGVRALPRLGPEHGSGGPSWS